jgi:hypothetical protein
MWLTNLSVRCRVVVMVVVNLSSFIVKYFFYYKAKSIYNIDLKQMEEKMLDILDRCKLNRK